MVQHSKKLITLAIAFSLVALGGSVYAALSTRSLSKMLKNETTFNAKIEKGIEAYIKKQQDAQNKPPEAAAERVEVSVDDDAVRGDANAKVTIIEFSDFECPYCGRNFTQTFPKIDEKYIKTGKAKYVFRDFPLGFHQNAIPAAIAANCVREQGGDEMFWSYHDKLYSNQKSLDAASLKKFAGEVGADEAKFKTCLDSQKFKDEVDKDMKDGQAVGVQGTPAFFVNGRLISGAVPFEVFEKAIEEELAK